METENKHWRNKVEVIEEANPFELRDKLNEFYSDKFVIATQIWSDLQTKKGFWVAIVYYKVPPESS